jgi:TPR repeat protein
MIILPKPLLLLSALIGLGLLFSGCQTSAPRLTAVEYKGTPLPSILGLQQEFLSQPDLMTRYLRLSELEAQALALAADEPLRLGSVGSAILEIYPASYTGHFVLEKFYRDLESSEAQQLHAAWLRHIRETTIGDADGSTDAPYKVMSINDARTFLAMQGLRETGALYQSNAETALGLTMLARENAQAPLRTQQFDLTSILQPLTADLAGTQTVQPNNPWPLLRELASSRNSAAQASIGTFLAKQRRFEAALGWLEVAARPGNLFANSLLARIYWFKAGTAQKQEQQQSATDSDDAQPTAEEFKQMALENHLQAVALGSADSMYSLGRLYIEEFFGPGNNAEGITLLEQAGRLGKAEALLYLGHQFRTGQRLEANPTAAKDYLEQAAALQNPTAIISYARYLTTATGQENISAHERLMPWLLELADTDHAEAMVVLGNLSARGIAVPKSSRRALKWYKKAVRNAGSHHHGAAEIINEVSWTLATTPINSLRDSRYARTIMDKLMAADEAARDRPEYLDTWATTYAANGDFVTAIDKQQQAISKAEEQQRDDVLEILRMHLSKFKAGDRIVDQVP